MIGIAIQSSSCQESPKQANALLQQPAVRGVRTGGPYYTNGPVTLRQMLSVSRGFTTTTNFLLAFLVAFELFQFETVFISAKTHIYITVTRVYVYSSPAIRDVVCRVIIELFVFRT